jgi:poly [ADP-ribose] polymerase
MKLQLIYNGNHYQTWTRWGRVGDRGQSKALGSGGLNDAMKQFDSKFKDKSGLAWANRGDKPKAGKYTFIERAYGDDEEEDEADGRGEQATEQRLPSPESTLARPVQELMELIFNQQYFAAAMTDLNYDVNKLPLGKLSNSTITRGYQALKDLSALLGNPSLAQSEYGTSYPAATEQLSNAFYSLIPHAFGRSRPPIIQDQAMLNKEIDLLDSLSDMKDAANIMKKELRDVEKINVLDRQFKGLNLDEMTPLKSSSTEFLELKNYLVETKGQTHHTNYQVDQIFRIERQGEKERFDKSPFSGPPRNR